MPGPGGGSRGGGFGGGSRGGGFGGSRGGFGGGSHGFGGGPHRHYHGHYGYHRPFFFWGGPRYYGGGGCLGGLLGMIFAPIIIILVSCVMLVSTLGYSIGDVMSGGTLRYNEAQFQDYANAQYAAEFGDSTAYEDNILIIFLANEKRDGYYCIAWVGDNINSRITNMFGDENTVFGRAVTSSVSDEFYAYSLDKSLATVTETMQQKITDMGLASSFVVIEDHSVMTESHLTNLTDIDVTEKTVNTALSAFTEATDIPMVIVIDNMENVFERKINTSSILTVLVLAAVIILSIVSIVRSVKAKREYDRNNDQNRTI